MSSEENHSSLSIMRKKRDWLRYAFLERCLARIPSVPQSILWLHTWVYTKKRHNCSSYITFQVLMHLLKIEEKLSNRWNLLCNNDLPESDGKLM